MRSRRFLFVAVLAALAVAALVAGRGSSGAPATSAPSVAPRAATLAAANGVWFCPGLPPALPHRSARVTFANVGTDPADVVVTDLTDRGTVTTTTLRVLPQRVVTRTRDQLGAAGALTVEAFGGRVVVEEGIDDPHAFGSVACATQASPHWYFAAGTTPRGVQQWLVIENPYASDAKVDVTLRTSAGVRRPDALQGIDVARRSRTVIAVHDVAVREARVAVEVDAEVGAVVAAQSIVYTNDAAPPGVALALGQPVASTETTFAGGIAAPGSSQVVAVVNVGDDDTQVDVQAMAESARTSLAPVTFTLAQDEVAWVGLGGCPVAGTKACVTIPDGARYTLDVRSEQDVAIAAQTFARFGAPNLAGTVTSPGATQPARAWTFARSRATGERSTTISFTNPGAAAAKVDVALVHDGRIDRPRSLQQLAVAPGRSVTAVVVGGSKPAAYDAALVVTATEPVYAQRTIATTTEAATSIGVAG